MTTLIITEKGFYSDGRMTVGNEILSDSFAKAIVYKGVAIAVTGEVWQCIDLAKAIIDNEPTDEFKDFEGCVLTRKSGITYYTFSENGEIKTHRRQGFETFGSGSSWARAAIDFGKTPEEAIKYAMTRDTNTGGEIFKVMFEDLE